MLFTTQSPPRALHASLLYGCFLITHLTTQSKRNGPYPNPWYTHSRQKWQMLQFCCSIGSHLVPMLLFFDYLRFWYLIPTTKALLVCQFRDAGPLTNRTLSVKGWGWGSPAWWAEVVPFAADTSGWLLREAEREFISTPPTFLGFFFFVCVCFFPSLIEIFSIANLSGDNGEEAR